MIKSTKDKDVCTYVQQRNSVLKTSCGRELRHVLRSFQFCPFCGKKLKIIRRNNKGEIPNEFFDHS